jgi:hypothetical protein
LLKGSRGPLRKRSIDQNLQVYKTFNFRSYFLSFLVQRDDCNKAINQHTLHFCPYLMLWQKYLRTISFNILGSPHAITCTQNTNSFCCVLMWKPKIMVFWWKLWWIPYNLYTHMIEHKVRHVFILMVYANLGNIHVYLRYIILCGHDSKNCLYHFKIILKNIFCTFVKRKKIILEWIPRKSVKFMCSKLLGIVHTKNKPKTKSYKTFNFRSYFLSFLVQRDDCNKAITQHTLHFCPYLMLW